MTTADPIEWRQVESSNVVRVGWDKDRNLYVHFAGPTLYIYHGVSRQHVVALSRAKSVGQYIHKKIIPNFTAVRIV